MASCVFCDIVAGTEPASVVFEDDATLAFMSLRQANPGHVLVIPKTHVPTIFELHEDLAAHVMRSVVRVARAVRAALAPDGLNILQFNGEAAHQDVFHVHFHIFPRRLHDGLLNLYPQVPPEEPRAALDALARQVAAAFSPVQPAEGHHEDGSM